MRILLDTNIIIYREDDHVLSFNLQKLIAALNKLGAAILVHPLSLEDLKKDSDELRRKVILSKIGAYPALESPPNLAKDVNYLLRIGVQGQPTIDDKILYSVYKDAVDFLITEDRGIHKKARSLNVSDRVLLIGDALQLFSRYIQKRWEPPLLPLKREYVYNLNLSDPIFDSLRKDYGEKEFNRWLVRISREGRECLVYFKEDSNIGAILIYKIEDEAIDSSPPLTKKKRLKLSTFKVTHVGHKIGELFIRLSIDIAIKNNIAELYLTHFKEPKDDPRLVELISEYGFWKEAENSKGENVFVKRIITSVSESSALPPLEIAKRFYPSFYDGPVVRKFIVPIRPEYHSRLFTDFEGRQITLLESAGTFIVEGNTIKKAYICHAKTQKMQPGDVVFFYLSQRKILTALGVVEVVYKNMRDSDEILRYVSKRTVYSKSELDEIAQKPSMVILFMHHFYLKRLPIRQLQDMKVLAGHPQSIVQITDEGYSRIKTEGGIDERFAIH